MVRETAALKAETTARRPVALSVVRADGRHIRAIVRGDTEGFHWLSTKPVDGHATALTRLTALVAIVGP